jgi:bacteriorhodopsin
MTGMKTKTTTDNSIFLFAFFGSLLFIAAIVLVVANLMDIPHLQLSNTLLAVIPGVTSVSLLYKAIKEDKNRLKKPNPAL